MTSTKHQHVLTFSQTTAEELLRTVLEKQDWDRWGNCATFS